MAAYRRRRARELRELAIAVSYGQHAPGEIDQGLQDESELTDMAEARGFETDTDVYWE